MKTGKLYLIPSGLGSDDINYYMPNFNQEIINTLTTFIVEDARTARRFLKTAGYTHSLDTIELLLLNKHTLDTDIPSYLKPLIEGKNIGLLSEAGCPCIADPGAQVVKLAQEKNIEIIPLIGPSSIMLALMASGFNGQNFAFLGYLPIEPPAKIKRIKRIETAIYQDNQTQIFIETPFRNTKIFQELLATCRPTTMLCIATDITLATEMIKTKSIQDWKKHPIDLNKKPTVFLLYK